LVEIDESLRRIAATARRPAPLVGFDHPPRTVMSALRGAADEAAAAGATLALLDAGPRDCIALLEALESHVRAVELHLGDVIRSTRGRLEPRLVAVLATDLECVATSTRDAATWWCRSAGCAPAPNGLSGSLRDAGRALANAIAVYELADGDEAVALVHYRASEGRRLARLARAHAIEHGDIREVLGHATAIEAVERGLRSCGRAACTLQRLRGA
jgi:hypothetical protein